jgi:hypothetical protein
MHREQINTEHILHIYRGLILPAAQPAGFSVWGLGTRV